MPKEALVIKNVKSHFKSQSTGQILIQTKAKGPQMKKNGNPSGQTRKGTSGTEEPRADKDGRLKKNQSCERRKVESEKSNKIITQVKNLRYK